MHPRSREFHGAAPTERPTHPSDAQEQEQHEEKAARERTAISAGVVYEAILAEGKSELARPTSALAFSGLAAGLSMGFSFITQALLESHLPQASWTPLISKLGYSVGFLIVILGRQQLFTENTLTPVLPFLADKDRYVLANTLRLWATVLLANWVGTMVIGWVLAHSAALEQNTHQSLLHIAREAMQPAFSAMLVKAVFAGWLIALLVWLLPFAETARVGVIILMTYVIGIGSFSHIIAGSVDTFYLVAVGEQSFGKYLAGFMLPTLIGNVVGGVALVAVLNHAQVKAGAEVSTDE